MSHHLACKQIEKLTRVDALFLQTMISTKVTNIKNRLKGKQSRARTLLTSIRMMAKVRGKSLAWMTESTFSIWRGGEAEQQANCQLTL